MSAISNRYEFVIFFDVENGNRFETYTIADKVT